MCGAMEMINYPSLCSSFVPLTATYSFLNLIRVAVVYDMEYIDFIFERIREAD